MSSKDSFNVVDLSSDDEDPNPESLLKTTCKSEPEVNVETPRNEHSSTSSYRPQLHSFWKAGNYDPISTLQTTSAQGQMEHVRVHPKFLHSNATSHKWAFGAIAELLDNAVDEICNGATFVKVDRIYNARDNSPALLFHDNGGGMDPECMRRCMSLGYSSKKSNTTIGQYGNGFKTSTMRLGADAIVFSRTNRGSCATQSIGLLSYTFLRGTGQDDIIVPIVDFELCENHTQPIVHSSQDDWDNNLKIILEWSPFQSKDELMQQFDDIGLHGTKVLVYNLWLNDDNVFELDLDDDDEDIRLRDEAKFESVSRSRKGVVVSHISYLFRFSLRAYVSILYLRKFVNFQVILRGKPVQQLNIADELKFSKVIKYKPNLGITSNEVLVETTVGFVKEAPLLTIHGFNVYHKNRLIMPFWKVTHDSSSRGSSVVGVLEANFMEPAHDKQDFERTAVFLRVEMRLKQMMFDYWKTHCHLIGYQTPGIPKIHDLRQELPSVQTVVGLAAMNGKADDVRQELPSAQTMVGLAAKNANINDFQQELPSVQTVFGLAARNSKINDFQQGMHTFQTVVGLAAKNTSTNILQPELPSGQTVVGLAAPNGLNSHASIASSQSMFYSEFPVEHCPNEIIKQSTGGEDTRVDIIGSTLLDKIADENIELFLRIDKLENELKEARKRCSQLAFNLENRKKQKNIIQ